MEFLASTQLSCPHNNRSSWQVELYANSAAKGQGSRKTLGKLLLCIISRACGYELVCERNPVSVSGTETKVQFCYQYKSKNVFLTAISHFVLGMTFFFSFLQPLFFSQFLFGLFNPFFIWTFISRHFETFQDISRHFETFQDIRFGLLFPFSIWTFIFLFYLDFYFETFRDISKHFETFRDISTR